MSVGYYCILQMYPYRFYRTIPKLALKYYYINNYSNVSYRHSGGNDGGGGGGGGSDAFAFVVICGLLYYTISK